MAARNPNIYDPYGQDAEQDPYGDGSSAYDPTNPTGATTSPTSPFVAHTNRATDDPTNPTGTTPAPATTTSSPTAGGTTTPPPSTAGDPTADSTFLNQPGIANGGGWGGGWDQTWANGLPHALQAAIGNGLTGQAAIDWIAKTYPELADQANQIQYYPQNGQYGLPGNMYVAPNPQNNGALDLIQRSGTDTGGAAGGAPGGGLTVTDPEDPAEHDAILNLLSEGQSPVTGATVSAQYQPAANAIQQSATLQREQSAQRNAVEGTGALGGGGGANDGDIGSIQEDAGTQQATLMSTLIGDELNRRLQEVTTALQSAQGEDKIKLQAELADLQNQQFYDQFTYNAGRDTNSDNSLTQLMKLLGLS